MAVTSARAPSAPNRAASPSRISSVVPPTSITNCSAKSTTSRSAEYAAEAANANAAGFPMSCPTRTRTSSSSTGSPPCQTCSFSAVSSPQGSGRSRDNPAGSSQVSSASEKLLVVMAIPPVLAALPEQLRLDRHGGTQRLGACPLMHADPVHDAPPPVPAFVPVQVPAPPGVQLPAAVAGAQQVRDVVDLAGGVAVVGKLDRVVEHAVHGRLVAAVGPHHPRAQVRGRPYEYAVVVGGVVVVGAAHQVGVQAVDSAAVTQYGLPDSLGCGCRVGGGGRHGRHGRHLALGGHVEDPADPVVARRPGRRNPDAQLGVGLEQRAFHVPAIGREPAPPGPHGDVHGAVPVVGVVGVRVKRVPDGAGPRACAVGYWPIHLVRRSCRHVIMPSWNFDAVTYWRRVVSRPRCTASMLNVSCSMTRPSVCSSGAFVHGSAKSSSVICALGGRSPRYGVRNITSKIDSLCRSPLGRNRYTIRL